MSNKARIGILFFVSIIIGLAYFVEINNKLTGKTIFDNPFSINNESKIECDNIKKYIDNQSDAYSYANFFNDSIVVMFNKLSFTIYKSDNIVNQQLNNSLRYSLYSLSFLRNTLLNNSLRSNLTQKNIKLINKFIKELYDSNRFISFSDKRFFSDHPVSERLETLLLYYQFLNENNSNLNFRFYLLDKIHELAILLSSDFYFTYDTNHGLMQLRALFNYALVTNDENLIKEINKRIINIIPIFFASDGSVLESATGYHVYIIKQFKMLQEKNALVNFNNELLNITLSKADNYLNSITNADGFLQGLGDSYNVFIETKKDSLNVLYNYANGLAGMAIKNKNFSLTFVSLDNYPSVHKLPEDLSLYLYYQEPFFINTGTYSYNPKDKDRIYICSNSSQPGIHFINQDSDSSRIFLDSDKLNNINLRGVVYCNTKKIKRNVIIKDNFVLIKDSSNVGFVSRFIVNPKIKIKQINKHTINLIGQKQSMVFYSQNEIEIDTSWISNSLFNRIKAIRLNSYNSNTIKIKYSKLNFNLDLILNTQKEYSRYKTIDRLKEQYPRFYFLAMVKYIEALFVALLLFFLVIVLLLLIKRQNIVIVLLLLFLVNITLLYFFDVRLINFVIMQIL